MQFYILIFGYAALFFELLFRADNLYFAAVGADPYGQGRAPIPVARKTPVYHVVEEVAHSALFYRFGHPVYRAVCRLYVLFYLGDFDKPARTGVIQKGRVAAPAMGIVVLEGHYLEEAAAFFEHFDYHLVGLLCEQSVQCGEAPVEAAALVYKLDYGEAVALAHLVVVLTEGGRNVNNARAVAHSYVGVAHDKVRFYLRARWGNALYLCRGFGKERFVFQTLPLFSVLFGYYCIIFKEFIAERLGEDIPHPLALDFNVGLVGVDAQRDVGGKSPGRGRPGEDVAVFFALYLEAGDYRIFLYQLIALRNLVRGERRAAAGAIGHDFVTLV